MQKVSQRVLLRRFIATVPTVKKELRVWSKHAALLPDPLRSQALASIELKAFHCVGGSVYAHYPGADKGAIVRLIVAFQTISDYLDNLCDRLHVSDPDAFRLLHTSITDALIPGAPLHDYYGLYPYREETYLPRLVETCQELLGQIPHYSKNQSVALHLAEKYCELQVLKHVSDGGEDLLQKWSKGSVDHHLAWNEWAAACGSTLGIFFLFAAGYNSPSPEDEQVLQAYFPWIQGLHILLDYLIDLAEDQESGDLNFVTFYPTTKARDLSLCKFAQESKRLANKLPNPNLHSAVVDGLIALYGSDPKVRLQAQEGIIRGMADSRRNLRWLGICKGLRSLGVI
ncbi:MAG: tetraprenyl-beta-curcumene synthase family protein [Limnochordia bacterium]|jgi:tetraprenyl-beta-curcumene synthase|nr:tetraprenyl-beta-curcumene synthase family protein [Limnochordia bacterium]